MLRSQFINVKVTRGQAVGPAVSVGGHTTALSNALAQARTSIGASNAVARCLRHRLKQLGQGGWCRRKPWTWGPPIPSQDGGYASVECRVFREAMREAGFQPVLLLASREPPLGDTQPAGVKRELGKTVLSSDERMLPCAKISYCH